MPKSSLNKLRKNLGFIKISQYQQLPKNNKNLDNTRQLAKIISKEDLEKSLIILLPYQFFLSSNVNHEVKLWERVFLAVTSLQNTLSRL
jgi:hypothetical protein